MDLSKQRHEAAEYLALRLRNDPKIAVVLGSGLGPLADEVDVIARLPYGQIPHFPVSTVHGHAGELVAGDLGGVPVIFMRGRVHYYEGVPLTQATLPVRVLGELGIETVIITNASGGIADHLDPGDIVAVTDHINLMGANPLIGYHPDEGEARFVDLTHAYGEPLRSLAHEEAEAIRLDLKEGVYAAMSGPSYETPAEIRFLRSIGADLIGMSTVPEVIVASQIGLPVLVLSCVSNKAAGSTGEKLDHSEVIETAERVAGPFTELIRRIISRLGSAD